MNLGIIKKIAALQKEIMEDGSLTTTPVGPGLSTSVWITEQGVDLGNKVAPAFRALGAQETMRVKNYSYLSLEIDGVLFRATETIGGA